MELGQSTNKMTALNTTLSTVILCVNLCVNTVEEIITMNLFFLERHYAAYKN